MSENQAVLLFMGVILGLCLLCASLIVGISKYREFKRKRAFKKHKDLREASFERDKLNHKYCEESREYTRIYNLIKYELERKPYLTKIKAFQQEKELVQEKQKIETALKMAETELESVKEAEKKGIDMFKPNYVG